MESCALGAIGGAGDGAFEGWGCSLAGCSAGTSGSGTSEGLGCCSAGCSAGFSGAASCSEYSCTCMVVLQVEFPRVH